MPGADQCIVNLWNLKKRLDDSSKKAVLKWSKDTIAESRDKFCPKLTGHLRSTAKAEVEKDTLTEFHVRLSYNTPYANRQHETPWYHHPTGQWKYLSTPFNNRIPLLNKMLFDAWRSEL